MWYGMSLADLAYAPPLGSVSIKVPSAGGVGSSASPSTGSSPDSLSIISE